MGDEDLIVLTGPYEMGSIGIIVSSNSHIDYVARVHDELDVAEPPSPDQYGFGGFVRIPFRGERSAVAVIYDSKLVNPEYSGYGPRLSPQRDLQTFSPDFLNEQGILLGLLLLGTIGPDGPKQEIPAEVVAPGAQVFRLDEDEFVSFHRDKGGAQALGYFPTVLSIAGGLAAPLLENVIARLESSADDRERSRLELVRKNLSWQRTMASVRQ